MCWHKVFCSPFWKNKYNKNKYPVLWSLWCTLMSLTFKFTDMLTWTGGPFCRRRGRWLSLKAAGCVSWWSTWTGPLWYQRAPGTSSYLCPLSESQKPSPLSPGVHTLTDKCILTHCGHAVCGPQISQYCSKHLHSLSESSWLTIKLSLTLMSVSEIVRTYVTSKPSAARYWWGFKVCHNPWLILLYMYVFIAFAIFTGWMQHQTITEP